MTSTNAIPALRDYWSRVTTMLRSGRSSEADALRVHRDRMLTDSLGLGQEQVARFLSMLPDFEAFERFVLDCHGGAIDATRIAWVNALQDEAVYPPQVVQRHADVRALAPVLDAADLAHWDEHGYVVLRDAITPAECAAASATVYAQVGADPGDPSTWHDAGKRQGIMVQLFQHPAFEAARTALRVHKAFAQLWGTEDLVATTDRCGFNPPEGGAFRFSGPHLHWDAELVPPLPFGVQGILYLEDTPAAQGAFTCVPGFHRVVDAWLRALPAGVDPYSRIPQQDARPVAGKAGDLVIWHHGLPHGASANRGVRPRIVQYLTMYPARAHDRASDRNLPG